MKLAQMRVLGAPILKATLLAGATVLALAGAQAQTTDPIRIGVIAERQGLAI